MSDWISHIEDEAVIVFYGDSIKRLDLCEIDGVINEFTRARSALIALSYEWDSEAHEYVRRNG